MKKYLLSALMIAFAAVCFAQDGVVYDKNVQVRNVSGFSGIRVTSGIKLYLRQGNTEAVAVSADNDDYRDKIKTVVENGVLKIFYDENWLRSIQTYNKHPKAYVTVKSLNKLQGAAGAYIKIEGGLTANDLNIDLSSGSVLNGDIKASSVSIDQSSGSIIEVSGSVGKLSIESSSGSIFHGYDMTADAGDANSSSGSVVEITANKDISVKASSGGLIRYKGSAVITSISTSSGGSVKKRG